MENGSCITPMEAFAHNINRAPNAPIIYLIDPSGDTYAPGIYEKQKTLKEVISGLIPETVRPFVNKLKSFLS